MIEIQLLMKAKKLKILHLLPILTGGGAENQMSYLANQHQEQGHKVYVAFIHKGSGKSNLSIDTDKIYQLRAFNNYDPFIFFQILKIIFKVKPDIIQTWIMQMDIIGGIAAKLTSVPWLLREPNSSLAYKIGWKFKLRRFVARWADAIVSNSKSGDDYWNQYYPNKKKFIVPNGIPVEKIIGSFDELKELSYLTNGKGFILYAGRLEKHKNPEKLISISKNILIKKDVFLIICGVGPLKNVLEKSIDELGLNNKIHIIGFVDSCKLWALMKRASLFITLSEHEGHPNVLLESIICNCPVIVSDIPEHREFLDDKTANFVNPNDSTQITESILKLLNNREVALTKARNAYNSILNLSISNMANSYEDIYYDLNKGKRGK